MNSEAIQNPIERLLAISSGPLLPPLGPQSSSTIPLMTDLALLLEARNGFYAFESALHVFPSGESEQVMTAETWNDSGTWKHAYQDLADDLWCFAEDVFGYQFAVQGDAIFLFDPETGAREKIAASVTDWAGLILNDYSRLTGHAVARQWQQVHGPLLPSTRLLPAIPFVMQGGYELSNLFAGEVTQGMQARGSVAVQIRDLPDGTTIEYVVGE